MHRGFEEKVVWITGGGSGIGRAMALEFARRGANVALSGRRKELIEGVAREVEALGRASVPIQCDVTKESEVAANVEGIISVFGKLDVVVANAGFAVIGSFEKLELADWQRQFDTNVFGVITTVKHALPELRKTNGRIAIIASVSGFLPLPQSGAYGASKAAVRCISNTLSIELHGSGVSCTAIHPGFVESDIGRVDNQGRFRPERKESRPAMLIWPAERAARVMVEAIHKRKQEYCFTTHGKIGIWATRFFPGLTSLAIRTVSQRK